MKKLSKKKYSRVKFQVKSLTKDRLVTDSLKFSKKIVPTDLSDCIKKSGRSKLEKSEENSPGDIKKQQKY